jgi:hypothetical protein
MADTKKPPLDRTVRIGTTSSERPPSFAGWEAEDLARTVRVPPPPPSPVADDRYSETGAPLGKGVEIFVVDETQLSGGARKQWRAAEVWTKRRIYGLDSSFTCIEVLDRESGRLEPAHPMIGARLGGGRLREPDDVRFSYPLPLPGMEAMFMKARKHGYTSPVERMVVRVRVLHTSPDEVAPTWDDIASRWSEPPPK